MTGNAQDVDAPCLDFDHEEHIQPSQHHSVDVEEIARQQPVRLRAHELLPTRTRPPRRWLQTGCGEDPTNRSLPYAVSEPDRFTLNPAVTPSWVLRRQPQHQITDLRSDRRTTGRFRAC